MQNQHKQPTVRQLTKKSQTRHLFNAHLRVEKLKQKVQDAKIPPTTRRCDDDPACTRRPLTKSRSTSLTPPVTRSSLSRTSQRQVAAGEQLRGPRFASRLEAGWIPGHRCDPGVPRLKRRQQSCCEIEASLHQRGRITKSGQLDENK